jgi:hypothetical protein
MASGGNMPEGSLETASDTLQISCLGFVGSLEMSKAGVSWITHKSEMSMAPALLRLLFEKTKRGE